MANFPGTAKVMMTSMKVAALALSFGLTASIASAQTSEPTNVVEDPAPNPWWKICNEDKRAKKTVCIVKQDILTEAGQFLASIQVHESEGEARKRLIAAVAPGMQIQPGLQVKVDEQEGQLLKYGICLEDACIAELAIKGDFVTTMKGGGKLTLTAVNQQGKQRPFSFSLNGFVDAYDGAGLNEKEAQKHQQALRKQAEGRATSLRQKLIDAQRKATGNQ